VPGPLDSVTWRVYSAEQSIDPGPELNGIADARALVQRIKKSNWWRTELVESPRVRLKIGGGQTGDWRVSWASPNASYCPTSWLLSFHPQMINEIVVLHELAHCLSPRRWGNVKQLRRERLDYGDLPMHGPAFTGLLSALVAEFGAGVNHEDLSDAYRHFEVPIAEMSHIREAVLEGREVESLVLAMIERSQAEQDAREAERERNGEPPREYRVPTVEWGWWLLHMRRHVARRRGEKVMGRQALADRITPMERCSVRDIQRVEESEAPPADPHLRRIAMAMVAALGIDPVWARHSLGLVRWDSGVELEELRLVNADWADYVNHLNTLLEQRPPYWTDDGER
jgi:hypothetical protein